MPEPFDFLTFSMNEDYQYSLAGSIKGVPNIEYCFVISATDDRGLTAPEYKIQFTVYNYVPEIKKNHPNPLELQVLWDGVYFEYSEAMPFNDLEGYGLSLEMKTCDFGYQGDFPTFLTFSYKQ